MFKKCLLILLALISLPVFAGEVESAINNGNNVFLYLYTPDCGYCKEFAPHYNQLTKAYNGKYSFFKIDATSPYGRQLMRQYNGTYVPYVLLLNRTKGIQINPSCLMDDKCVNNALVGYRK